jgi:hypothetical protein
MALVALLLGVLASVRDSHSAIFSGGTLGPVQLQGSSDGSSFGRAATALSDGSRRVAIGAPAEDSFHGAVHIFGHGGGAFNAEVTLNASVGRIGIGESAQFGTSVASGGPQLFVGAAGVGQGAGALFVLTLAADGGVNSTIQLNQSSAVGLSLLAGDLFGAAAATFVLPTRGRVLAVGAPGNGRGVVHVFGLDAGYDIVSPGLISPLSSPVDYSAFGSAVAYWNATGQPMLIVGAPNPPGGTTGKGAIFICKLNDDGSLKSSTMFQPANTTLSASAHFGSSVSVVDAVLGFVAVGAKAVA